MKNLLCAVLRVLCRVFFRVRIKNVLEDAPPNDLSLRPLLVIANHQSLLDGVLLGLFLPIERPMFVVYSGARKYLLFRVILWLSDYLTVDTTNPMTMKKVLRVLESGRPVVIFPEGRLTTTGSMMKVYEGPAFVAAKTGAYILPVRLDGPARSYFSRLTRQPRRFFPRITLNVLPLTTLPMPEAPTAKLRRRKAGEEMRRLMQKMSCAAQYNQTLYGSLCEAIRLYGRSRRVVEDIRQIEYRYQDVLKMSLMLGRLTGRLTRPGERVGLLLPNMTPTVALFMGLCALKRVPAMLNYTAGADGMQAACDAAEIRTLITSRAFVEQTKLQAKLDALQGVTRVLHLEDLGAQATLFDKLWLTLYALWFPARVEVPASPEDTAVVLFTSGSEGRPKGVALSHRAVLANIAQIRAIIDFTLEDRVLNVLPIFHAFGLTAGTLLPFLSGASLFLYPSPLHYRVIPELAYDRGCTVLFGTSAFLGNYARFAHPYDFYRLRYVVAGAEKLSDAVRDAWFEKFGLRILEGYGATETAPVLAVNTPMAFRSGTVGQFLPGLEYRLQPVPGILRGGILHVRGPNVMNGYLKADQPGALLPVASEIGEGWYETGDVVDIDADGFVHILGRARRFAKIAGEMVNLEAVEKLALAASQNGLHAVSSCPNESKGERLILFTTDEKLKRADLQASARALGMPELAVPKTIVCLPALPLLGTGKVDYVELKRMAEAEA
ncbi:MAG: bifunctional acyl-ACP--phospholipid O-acyltransferase/long-chain-fatty-acid--ACP ligase [Zoogloeaceae bacterium]|nr:bifunctional acyl-ACP--phospholipid O-acyltransferase/long-chain-fatty-acid--ACP ligase [Zoogloeaceae bacterium]